MEVLIFEASLRTHPAVESHGLRTTDPLVVCEDFLSS
jgi:hypothetical protein